MRTPTRLADRHGHLLVQFHGHHTMAADKSMSFSGSAAGTGSNPGKTIQIPETGTGGLITNKIMNEENQAVIVSGQSQELAIQERSVTPA